MNKLKVGDEVIVLKGKSKGIQGKIKSFMSAGKKVVVEGVNMAKKHVKPNPNKNEQGGIIEKEMPIDVSNVAIFDAVAKKGTRVKIKTVDGKNVRVYASSGEQIV